MASALASTVAGAAPRRARACRAAPASTWRASAAERRDRLERARGLGAAAVLADVEEEVVGRARASRSPSSSAAARVLAQRLRTSAATRPGPRSRTAAAPGRCARLACYHTPPATRPFGPALLTGACASSLGACSSASSTSRRAGAPTSLDRLAGGLRRRRCSTSTPTPTTTGRSSRSRAADPARDRGSAPGSWPGPRPTRLSLAGPRRACTPGSVWSTWSRSSRSAPTPAGGRDRRGRVRSRRGSPPSSASRRSSTTTPTRSTAPCRRSGATRSRAAHPTRAGRARTRGSARPRSARGRRSSR